MKILFVHNNFPAQFGAFGQWLADRGHGVRYATSWAGGSPDDRKFIRYKAHRELTEGVHPYAANFEKAVIMGQSAARSFIAARDGGYAPDIVMAHSGWGPGLFAKDIWPKAHFIPYFEWWYEYPAPDDLSLGTHKFDLHAQLMQRVRNAPFLLDLEAASMAICPTHFQASRFPGDIRQKLTIIHDGVDCDLHSPAKVPLEKVAGLDLTAMPEVITFVTRGMEPHRGFPQFMRALARLQAKRPGLHAIIGGEDRVAYGSKLPEGESWKRRMLAELEGQLDLTRVHFIGLQPRPEYVRVLQASMAHIYLTADFVLSWSMLDAMAIAAPMVVSDCPPVREFMSEETGLLCPLHDDAALEARINEALDNREAMKAKGLAARDVILNQCDRAKIWPQKEQMLKALLSKS